MPPEVDTSIYKMAVPPPFNPLETVAKAQAVQGSVLQNRLFGQQVQGKETLGRIIGANTGPDGVTDWNRVSADASKEPNAAILLPDIQKATLERTLQEVQIAREKLGLSNDQWKVVGNAMLPLIAQAQTVDPQTGQPRGLTRDDVVNSLRTNIQGSGAVADPAFIQRVGAFVASLPEDPNQLIRGVGNVALMAEPTAERIKQLYGEPSTMDTGPGIQTRRVPTLTGKPEVLAVTPKGLSPESANELVDVVDQTGSVTGTPGATYKVPKAQALAQAGGSGGSPLVSSLAPGVAEGMTGVARGSVEQANQLRQEADRVPEQQAALKNILDTVNGFTPGVKTNWIYATKALATQLGVASPQMRDEVAAQEEFNKLATQFINQAVGSIGGTGTDAKLESARHGTPNEFMSSLGIKNVVPLMMGLNAAKTAKNEAWQKWLDAGNGPQTYGKFQTEFNRVYNPRVFQSEFMSDAQRKTMMANMDPAERKQFQSDWERARKYGWIK